MSEDDTHKTILERIAIRDQAAVAACVNNYGSWIWKLAVKKTHSKEAAEDLVLDISGDIWKYADRFDSAKQAEEYFILLIVHRRLIKNNNQEQRNTIILEASLISQNV